MSKSEIYLAIEEVLPVCQSLPLAKRLTDNERKKIRKIYKMSLLSLNTTYQRHSDCASMLINIFGKSLFKDIQELFDNGKLTMQTKV